MHSYLHNFGQGGAGVLHGFMTVGAALRHTYPDLIFEGMGM